MKKKKRSDQVGHQNGNIKYTSILIIITFFSMSCSSIKRNIDYDDVEAIKFWYISKYIETDIPITNCANIVYDTLINKDTIITDRIVIEKYITEINRLKPVNKHINYDLRVASAIKFKEGKQENMG
ncbi:MAG: hypothetical protein LBJ63_11660, partial [Prevotellaceae bacterium]|nr:hypothetical protein [Prevotellaceae bacterium]